MNKKDLKIIERVCEIEKGVFDEDDIKLLLIEIREKLKGETFLKEICHFIAHSDRNQGICHKKVDIRYAKLKFIDENTKKILTPEFVEKNINKPESFFSDAILNYINSDKIEKSQFELLILSGIDDVGNELFIKYYKLNKKQVKEKITKAYRLIDDYYIRQNTLKQTEILFIDDILKFIRGTVSGKPAFTENELFSDFLIGLKRLCSELKYKADFNKIKGKKDDLIVCIISLLHDSTFKLFDGTIGTGFISLHPEENGPEICLMSATGKYIFPLITTGIKARKYITAELIELKEYEFGKMPWYNCVRDDTNKLNLTKSEV